MNEDYCTDCGGHLPIKAFHMCVDCFNAWMAAAALRHDAKDLS